MFVLVKDSWDNSLCGVITCKKVSASQLQEELDKIIRNFGEEDWYVSEVIAQLPAEWECEYREETKTTTVYV